MGASAVSTLVIRLRHDSERGVLSVSDDGKGIPDRVASAGGMGLGIMRYRAELLGGSLEIRRRTSGGTTVTCRFRWERAHDLTLPDAHA
jgi:signal transduction histidine kinase